MARQIPTALMWTQYVAARLAAMGLTLLDGQVSLRTATTLGRLLYRFDRRHRQRTWSNLKQAFPQMDSAEIDRLARQSFEHLVKLAVEVCQTPRVLHLDSWAQRVRLGDVGRAVELLNSGRPLILVTGHMGNWEATGYILAVLGYRVEAIARPIDNRLINTWLLGIRERRGMRVLTKWDATDRVVQVIGAGGLVGFIADQNAGDKGIFVPFFNRLASTYKSIGLLAITQQVPILCGYARRLGQGLRYELGMMDIIEPKDWTDQRDPLYYVTARYTRAIENSVRLFPEQYLWMHRRWKSRPRHERLGQPIPSSLRHKLEGLPWMDSNTIDRLDQAHQPHSPGDTLRAPGDGS